WRPRSCAGSAERPRRAGLYREASSSVVSAVSTSTGVRASASRAGGDPACRDRITRTVTREPAQSRARCSSGGTRSSPTCRICSSAEPPLFGRRLGPPYSEGAIDREPRATSVDLLVRRIAPFAIAAITFAVFAPALRYGFI